MKINFLGAYDRHNYGDILFAQIHTRVLKKFGLEPEIKYLSTRKTSECVVYGGFSTDTLENQDNIIDEKLIVLGGDVLSVDWVASLGTNGSPSFFFLFRVLKKVFGFNFVNKTLRVAYKKDSLLPFILHGYKNVYFTGVSGGRFCSKNHKIQALEALGQAKRVSVRDEDSYKKLFHDKRINLMLSPDTALVMSDLFTKDELCLSEYLESAVKNKEFDEKDYIAFQIGNPYLGTNLEKITQELEKYCKNFNKSILFVPIGRATGHLDHLALQKIFKILSEKNLPVALLTSSHINAIMASIAFSRGYVGTSLHGAITAYSFEHKVCGLFPDKIVKLSSYLKTWVDNKDFVLSEVNDLSANMNKVFDENTFFSKKNLKEQKDMVYADIKNYLSVSC